MNVGRKIFSNSAWIIGCKIGQSVINLVVGMLTARYLGPSNYGLISYAASIVAFVVPIMQLGLTNVLVREIVQKPEKEGELIGSSLSLSLFSSIWCIIGVIVFVNIANAGEAETIFVCALYSLELLFQSVELVQYWFQAKLKSKYISIASLVAYIFVAAYKVFLLATGKSVYWFAVSYSLDYALISFILLFEYKKMGGQKLSFSINTAKDMLSRSRYYIVSSMMVVIFAQTDRIMLKLILDNSAVGYYTAATTIAGLFGFVFSAIIDSFRPVILEKFDESGDEFRKYMMMLTAIVVYLALAQCIVITLFSKYIVMLLYGSQYISTVSALRIVVWYTTFSYLGSIRNIWILAEQKQKYLWILNLSGAAANVILNMILIPLMGINGAALASLITQIFTNIIMNQIVKPIRPFNKIIMRGITYYSPLKLCKELIIMSKK